MRIFSKIRWIALLPIILLTLLTTPKAVDTDTAALLSQKVYVMEQALVMGQGVTTDGEYFYTSGAVTALNLQLLGKIDASDMTVVDKKINPLPGQCRKRGNDHIGGISYYNGKIYASVEGGDVCKACIVVFDCETLEPTGEIYDLPNELYDDGIPWLAVDNETGLLYASKWSHADTLHVYDVNNGMRPVRDIALTGIGELDRIQGGEFCGGTLYLSQDTKDSGNIKRILKADIATGEISLCAERDVGGEKTEAEGMTFFKKDGKTSLYVLDYNKLVGIFMREYEINR